VKFFGAFFLLCYAFNSRALTFDEAKHLLNRTRFFYSEKEIRVFMKLDRLKASRLAIGGYTGNVSKEDQPPFLKDFQKRKMIMLKALREKNWKIFKKELASFLKKYKPPQKKMKMMSLMDVPDKRAARKVMRQMQNFFYPRLQKWWLKKMIHSREPFREVMTLFWHNHFTSSFKKVRDLHLIYQQNELWRKKALGSFGDLARSAIYDPALGLYLDLPKSQKEKPNENLARELFELFTLGIGNYSEKDIREASKALTGFRYNRLKDVYFYRPKLHDDSVKLIFGKKGPFDPEDLIDIILERPETSRFIVTKIWKEFVSNRVGKKELDKYSDLFKKNNYDIRDLFVHIFSSDEFYDLKNRGVLVKSPLHFILSYKRFLDHLKIRPSQFDLDHIMKLSKRMGMDIFNPPNVKGWPGHLSWINSNSLLLRKSLVRRFLKIKSMKKKGIPFTKKRFIKKMSKVYFSLPPLTDLKKEKPGNRLRSLFLGPIFHLR
jgi:uncharacterized protein (DUF1800 family)